MVGADVYIANDLQLVKPRMASGLIDAVMAVWLGF